MVSAFPLRINIFSCSEGSNIHNASIYNLGKKTTVLYINDLFLKLGYRTWREFDIERANTEDVSVTRLRTELVVPLSGGRKEQER